jgi:hypothetical protein
MAGLEHTGMTIASFGPAPPERVPSAPIGGTKAARAAPEPASFD